MYVRSCSDEVVSQKLEREWWAGSDNVVSDVMSDREEEVGRSQKGREFLKKRVIDILRRVASDCQERFLRCYTKHRKARCSINEALAVHVN